MDDYKTILENGKNATDDYATKANNLNTKKTELHEATLAAYEALQKAALYNEQIFAVVKKNLIDQRDNLQEKLDKIKHYNTNASITTLDKTELISKLALVTAERDELLSKNSKLEEALEAKTKHNSNP